MRCCLPSKLHVCSQDGRTLEKRALLERQDAEQPLLLIHHIERAKEAVHMGKDADVLRASAGPAVTFERDKRNV